MVTSPSCSPLPSQTAVSTPFWLGKEAPRYTSYPPSNHFQTHITGQDYRQWLQALPEQAKLSLYFHIPFCAQLCWFCACHTRGSLRYEPLARYLEQMKQEITLLAQVLAGRGVVHSIHYGGGSPTFMKAEDFSALHSLIQQHFRLADSMDYAMEMDPRTSSREKLRAYAAAGVNRISFGIQDVHPEVQQAIHRLQPMHEVALLLQTARELGISSVNMDLVYGLPKQTVATHYQTLQEVIALRPDRIALFSYAHVPWVKKHQQLIDETTLPPVTERRAMYAQAVAVLEQAGYLPIGMDHFALPEDSLAKAAQSSTLVRNFQGYSAENYDALLGIGQSSISQLPQGYAQNSLQPVVYAKALQAGQFPIAKGWCWSEQDRQRKALIDHLMCQFQLSPAQIQHALSPQEQQEWEQQLQPFVQAELITYSPQVGLRFIGQDRMAVRLLASTLDAYRPQSSLRYSQVA